MNAQPLSTPSGPGPADLVDESEFARLMRRRLQALRDDVRLHRVVFIEQGGERHYPAFFLDPAYRRRDLCEVSRRLDDLPGGSKLQFFVNPKGSLGGVTPLEALRRRALAGVLRAADGFVGR